LRRAIGCAVGALLVVATAATPAWAVAPAAPSTPLVTSGNAQIVVTANTPADNGTTIVSYTATCTSSNLGAMGSATLTNATDGPITVTGLTNGDSYTCTVFATTDVAGPPSPASASLVVGAPVQPTQPTVSNGADTQLVVSSNTPSDNGNAIVSYTANCSTTAIGGAPGTATLISASDAPITVTGLTDADSYTCTVTATNGLGPSLASPASVAAIPMGPPVQPTQPAVTAGVGQIAVTSNTPFNNGSAIVSYTANCTSGNGGAPGSAPLSSPTDATITVTALTPGDSYTCTVTATNGLGPSVASPASAAAIPTGVPAQPAQPTVSIGDRQLTVTSNTPANNGSTIVSYTANCSTTAIGGAPGTATLTAAADAAITVTGLTDGDSYTCTVTATNGVGPSLASPVSASGTPIGVPAAPAQPTVTQGNLDLVVTYAAPANNGSQITSYSAVCTSTNGGVLGSGSYTSPDGSALPITVASVTSGKSYTCHVRATNAVGGSADSPESSPAVTVGGVPGAPSLPTLVSGNAQITVSFVAGAPNGAAVTGNTATCTSTNGGVTGSASGVSPIVVGGLTNGANYNCSVTSTNGIGPGPASPTASVVVGLPDGVAQPSVVSGDSQIVVGFVVPSLNGSPLVAYHATCLSAGNPVAFGSGMSSPVVATGAVDGQKYTCHVNAQNSVGEGPDSPESLVVVPAGVPGFPPAPTITPGNNVMQVVFVAPVANGAPITSYTATCSSSDGGVTAVMSGPASPINVTGLSDGNTYTCDVSATNSAGTGSISDESASAVAAGVPAAAPQATVVGGPARVVVSFGLPAANGSTVTSTTATCTSSNGGVTRSAVTQPQDVGQTFSPIVVAGLTNGKTYTCKVTATNGIGTGPASPASATVIPRSPPGVPTGVRAVSGNAIGAAGPVIVSFTAGTANGSAITSFQVTCTDGRNGLVFTKSGPVSPITVGGLSTGHPFSCVVAAINAGGTSPRSAAVTVTLGAPGQPTIARIVQSHHGVTLTVLAPIANGAPITRYVARCTSTNGGIGRGSASSGGQLIVTNMSLGATYTCTVTAWNSRGAGTPTKTTSINITK